MIAKPCIIVDLDGTIADTRHRVHHVTKTPKDWKAFFAACSLDEPYHYMRELLGGLHLGPIIICSGRPEHLRNETEAWLAKHHIKYGQLMMRAVSDHRPDTEVKKEMLDNIRAEGYEPVFAIDDRPTVVRMWRDNNVPCLVVDQSAWVGVEEL